MKTTRKINYSEIQQIVSAATTHNMIAGNWGEDEIIEACQKRFGLTPDLHVVRRVISACYSASQSSFVKSDKRLIP